MSHYYLISRDRKASTIRCGSRRSNLKMTRKLTRKRGKIYCQAAIQVRNWCHKMNHAQKGVVNDKEKRKGKIFFTHTAGYFEKNRQFRTSFSNFFLLRISLFPLLPASTNLHISLALYLPTYTYLFLPISTYLPTYLSPPTTYT